MLQFHINSYFFPCSFSFCRHWMNKMMFNPSQFFSQNPKLLFSKFKDGQIFSLGECVHLWVEWSGSEKAERSQRNEATIKLQRGARRATPGWQAGEWQIWRPPPDGGAHWCSPKLQLFFEHASFSYNRTVFSQTFLGRSVCVSRICRVKKFQNPTIHVSIVGQETHLRCEYDEHALWSWQPAEARQDPCLFFRAHDPDRSHSFWLELQWKKFGRTTTSKAKPPVPDGKEWHRLQEDAKKHVSARQGQGEDVEKQKGRLPPGEEVTRGVYVLPFENGRFWSQQRSKAEQSFSVGLSVGWAIDREARKLSGATVAKRQSWSEPQERCDKVELSHRSEATKLSGARMPEQCRAGQLVYYKIQKILQNQKGLLSRGATSWMPHFNVRNMINCLLNNMFFGTCCWEGNWCSAHWNEASSLQLFLRDSKVLFESERLFLSYNLHSFLSVHLFGKAM